MNDMSRVQCIVSAKSWAKISDDISESIFVCLSNQ